MRGLLSQVGALLVQVAAVLGAAACSPTVVPHIVQRDPPPLEILQCQEEPEMPATFPDEASRYSWSAMAIYAGRDCRVRLGALREWATNPPTAK